MKSVRKLYPHLDLKKWSLVFAVGVGLTIAGIISLSYRWMPGLVMGLVGVVMTVFSAVVVVRLVIKALTPDYGENVVEVLHKRYELVLGPKIVVVGGGTGLSTLLRGLKEFTGNLTAIVTVADDGGSSGRLRKEMGVLPPGDIRNCLVALADSEPLMARLFEYRFPEGNSSGLGGHNFGNLFIATMSAITGDFEEAVKESSRVLAVRGRVLPSTLDDVVLVAHCQGGNVVYGESTIGKCGVRIEKVSLLPENAKALPEALESIADADAIVLGPGSLFTSVIPNLLVEGIKEAILKSNAPRIYVCNVMTQPGETDGFTAADHVEAIIVHAGNGFNDDVVVNRSRVPPKLAEKYSVEGAYPVKVDRDRLRRFGIRIVEEDLMSTANYARHDSMRVAETLLRIISEDEKSQKKRAIWISQKSR
ncbi:MAG: YvcK family protein [Bacillota bacterium]